LYGSVRPSTEKRARRGQISGFQADFAVYLCKMTQNRHLSPSF
jgi:hypothetical protein